jgi:hypothetical protein
VPLIASLPTSKGNEEHAVMYRRIATEEAFATPAQLAESKRLLEAGGQEPGFAKLGGIIFGDSPGAKMIESMLLDIGDGRLAQMD